MDDDFIGRYVPALRQKNGEVFIPLDDFDQAPSIINRQVLGALCALGVKYDIEQKHIEMIKSLKDKNAGSRYDIKEQVVAIRDYDGVTLTRLNQLNLEGFSAPFSVGKTKLPRAWLRLSFWKKSPILIF